MSFFYIQLLFCSTLVLAASFYDCNKPLGLENGQVKDNQLTASSSFDLQSTGPQNARIRTEKGSGAWCPKSQINGTVHEWIQVDFPTETLISGVETQGRFDDGRGVEFPVAYMIEYWRNSLGIWQRYKDSSGNEIIPGNTETKTAVLRVLDDRIVANLVRIIPVSEFTRTVCLRFELYGCTNRKQLVVDEGLETDPLVNGDTLTYISIHNDGDEDKTENLKWIIIGIVAASTFGILSLAVLLYLLLCTKQILNRKKSSNMKYKGNSYYSPPNCQKNVKMSVHCDTAKRYVTPPIPSAYQNRYDSDFMGKHQHISSSTSSDSSDYAELLDCENLSEPLIKICSNEKFLQNSDSMHYASSLIATGTLPKSTQQPLSSFERFEQLDKKLASEMPVIMEFNAKALHLVEHIGNGEFGNLDVCTLERSRHVLVKYAKSDSKSMKGFEREKRVLSKFNHQNICSFYGIVNNNGVFGSILEFPAQGDLPNWLQKQKLIIGQEQLLSIVTQISAGMAYFESLGFVHRDLAARNCFVDADGTVKIADIGVLNPAYAQDYYQMEKDGLTQYLPIRWMACESLIAGQFTSQSDSWSLATTICEVFGLCAERPYSELQDEEVLANLEQTNELKHKCPSNCPPEIYDQLLLRCWVKDPNQRPTNSEIHRRLQQCTIEYLPHK